MDKDKIIGNALVKYFIKGYYGEVKEAVSAVQFAEVACSVLQSMEEIEKEKDQLTSADGSYAV